MGNTDGLGVFSGDRSRRVAEAFKESLKLKGQIEAKDCLRIEFSYMNMENSARP